MQVHVANYEIQNKNCCKVVAVFCTSATTQLRTALRLATRHEVAVTYRAVVHLLIERLQCMLLQASIVAPPYMVKLNYTVTFELQLKLGCNIFSYVLCTLWYC